VLGSNQRRLSRQFYRTSLRTESNTAAPRVDEVADQTTFIATGASAPRLPDCGRRRAAEPQPGSRQVSRSGVRRRRGLAVLVLRGDPAMEAELLVLQHEHGVLRRHAGRIRYEPADRLSFTALTRLIPRGDDAGGWPVQAAARP
jgi:hypothetical protein